MMRSDTSTDQLFVEINTYLDYYCAEIFMHVYIICIFAELKQFLITVFKFSGMHNCESNYNKNCEKHHFWRNNTKDTLCAKRNHVKCT